MKRIDAATLKGWIGDGQELAILDAREEGGFGPSHLFWAVPCPLSRMELRAPALLPRLDVRITCVDGGEGCAEILAAYLLSLGCSDVSVLSGGTPAWVAAGYVAFSGVHVPSKAFGEWVEHHYETPSVSAQELHAMITEKRDMVILDSRPMEEFVRMSIPGGIDVPGGELVYRFGEFVTRPETLVVVNCAGRTRSIMGAESLRSAGIPNEVVALRNGTMGWELAGFTCAHGRTESYPSRLPPDVETALSRADRFARQHGVRFITRAELAALTADATRTTHVLDVRAPEEYAEGHLASSLNAPGGQLVQSVDMWVAVRHARIVLVDDTGVRARMSAGWLRQLGGWEVFVLTDGLSGRLESGIPQPPCPEADAIHVPQISPAELAAMATAGSVQVVDLARSVQFRAGHVPSAIWGLRGRLARIAKHLTGDRQVVVTAPEAALAKLAVPELRALVSAPVKLLTGGTAAWKAAGFPMQADRRNPEDRDCEDVHLLPFDHNDGVEEAMLAYLAWEVDLVNEVHKDGDAPFGAWRS
ncbi:rhodanese-like domain-containing protein [Rhodovarius sp.]|uniref:rhodanese-like domain-containing protein n=1 Tax=Rhodovarius sp. TaxID=2972673 RepID=UPI00334064E5